MLSRIDDAFRIMSDVNDAFGTATVLARRVFGRGVIGGADGRVLRRLARKSVFVKSLVIGVGRRRIEPRRESIDLGFHSSSVASVFRRRRDGRSATFRAACRRRGWRWTASGRGHEFTPDDFDSGTTDNPPFPFRIGGGRIRLIDGSRIVIRSDFRSSRPARGQSRFVTRHERRHEGLELTFEVSGGQESHWVETGNKIQG